MKDNNLDDLIIDSSRVKKSSNKNVLTIIVLFAIILLITILLTKIMIDKPTVSPLADMNKTELANNDLLPDINTSSAVDLNESNVTSLTAEVNDSTKIGQVVKQESKEEQETKNKEELAKESLANETTEKVVKTIEPVKAIAIKEIAPKQPKKAESVKKVIHKEAPKAVVKKETDKVEKKIEPVKEVIKKEAPKVEKKAEAPKAIVKKEAPKIEPKQDETATGSYYIQAGAFGSAENVKKVENAIHSAGLEYKSLQREKGTKILVGPFSSKEKAESALLKVKSNVNKDAFIVKP